MSVCSVCSLRTRGRAHPSGVCPACRRIVCPTCKARLVPGPDVVPVGGGEVTPTMQCPTETCAYWRFATDDFKADKPANQEA